MRVRLSLALFLMLSACVSAPAGTARGYVTPHELNSNPSYYDGQSIVVRGFLVLGSQGRSLYESKERFAEWRRAFEENRPGFDPASYDVDCLTLVNADLLLDNQDLLAGRTVVIKGKFIKNYLDGTILDLQACGGPTALAVDEEDVRRLILSVQRH